MLRGEPAETASKGRYSALTGGRCNGAAGCTRRSGPRSRGYHPGLRPAVVVLRGDPAEAAYSQCANPSMSKSRGGAANRTRRDRSSRYPRGCSSSWPRWCCEFGSQRRRMAPFHESSPGGNHDDAASRARRNSPPELRIPHGQSGRSGAASPTAETVVLGLAVVADPAAAVVLRAELAEAAEQTGTSRRR